MYNEIDLIEKTRFEEKVSLLELGCLPDGNIHSLTPAIYSCLYRIAKTLISLYL